MTARPNRWKVLPHRRDNGQCRDCGQYQASSSARTCPRCAIEYYGDLGFFTMVNPVAAFEEGGRERWRQVAQQLRAGQLRSGQFYVFVGHNDGGPLERPLDVLLDSERDLAFANQAYEIGLALTQRYPQVWVVTTVGCWSITSGLA